VIQEYAAINGHKESEIIEFYNIRRVTDGEHLFQVYFLSCFKASKDE
jgi:hypothetical protein